MQKRQFNNRGVSLVEILGILALSSIIFVSISGLLRFNVRQNAIAQEKLVNSAVAGGVLNYVQLLEFDKIKTEVYGDTPYLAYTVFDKTTCDNLDFYNCELGLNPKVNNISYENRIRVVIYRYSVISNFIDDDNFLSEINYSEQIIKHLQDVIKADPDNTLFTSEHILRVIVVVESNINDHYDFLLEGVITNEQDINK